MEYYKDKFFDPHFHAYNLGHPNYSAFLDRFFSKEKNENNNYNRFERAINLIDSLINIRRKTLNLISVMNNDLGDYFLYIDYFLRANYKSKSDADNRNKFPIMTGSKYKKIILTPLVMDFGVDIISHDRRFERNIFYDLPPQKPVVSQVMDLFRGIKFYYENDIRINEDENSEKPLVEHINISERNETIDWAKENKMFEIYPFMGINTKHYTCKQLKKLLFKYFGKYDKYSGLELYNKFYDKLGTFDGNVYDETSDFNFLFTGIKVYPPLGFDPWPEDDEDELEKVKYLYNYCEQKGIPITTHCSESGFKTMYDYSELANPKKWKKVLGKFGGLKLNLAHMGLGNNESWKNPILDLVNAYENVYTDFADYGHSEKFYKELLETIKSERSLCKRLMFGSDFMVSLFDTDSYNDYLRLFFSESKLGDKLKHKLCNENPARFLFEKTKTNKTKSIAQNKNNNSNGNS